ncbi:uncharacterized protein LOC131150864 [Malania oleifera]|uniref:uncharacterized protein LOC131150864 n=1 Tax=Malania oleifera TaxID=397392 RepID=UPI0025AEB92C|nr:uncharacterized protein LOC131150864 [Malania oleifera]
MATKSPIFPMPEPHHFSDYGFDPQIGYFQVLEEARRHKREQVRSIDALHFKLQKPISKDDPKKTKKRRWWRNALLFFKRKWVHANRYLTDTTADVDDGDYGGGDVHMARARAFRGSISGPVYSTESRSGSSTPYRTRSRPVSGTVTPTGKEEVEIPYLSLRELTMEQQQQRMSTSSMPIYLVT